MRTRNMMDISEKKSAAKCNTNSEPNANVCGFLGYDREKNLHWHWAERKVVSSSQDGHGFVSRALPAAAGAAREGAPYVMDSRASTKWPGH